MVISRKNPPKIQPQEKIQLFKTTMKVILPRVKLTWKKSVNEKILPRVKRV